MSTSITYASSLFQSFKEIEADGYRSVLRFIEDHSTDIRMLPVEEYFALQYAYVAALYETGGYKRVVALTSDLIELSIIHNLNTLQGEDAYRALLFRRASSLFHLMRYKDCLYVCDQMLRLYPNFLGASVLYEKALYQQPVAWIAKARAFSVVLFLLAAVLIATQVLVFEYMLDDKAQGWIAILRNVCFFLGWAMLLCGDVGHRSWAWWLVRMRKRRYAALRAKRH